MVEFQQGIWRYHPKTKVFELFSEGGGNTYGLDFDKNGQVIAGTNWGGFAMLHQMQGAYYVKGFSKHGPLHNPHTYGYFDHVPYTGFKGGHVTCGGIVYQADTYPDGISRSVHRREPALERDLLAQARTVQVIVQGAPRRRCHRGQRSVVPARRSACKGRMAVSMSSTSTIAGPPTSTRSITGTRPTAASTASSTRAGRSTRPSTCGRRLSAELAELLKHPNVWWRREAREILAERQDKSVHPKLRKWLLTEKGDLALEALWALYVSGGWMERDFDSVGTHPNEDVRAWAVRFLVDDGNIPSQLEETLQGMAATEKSAMVLAQLACSAKRLPPTESAALASQMMDNPLTADDPQLPLLIWWALESANTRDKTDTVRFPYNNNPKLRDFFAERVARRFLSGDIPRGAERRSTLFDLTQNSHAYAPVLRGIATALQAHPLEAVPPPATPAPRPHC